MPRIEFTGGAWVQGREFKRGQSAELPDAVAADVVKSGVGRIAAEAPRQAVATAPAEARKAVKLGG
ncbi:hypothetical protein [Paludisphaera soli]|uniref:hypothetical protein n=1 Tax=Paludisphaera soli TaxID=2712865 RepID=UPI0013ECC99F|nr:hypothetical protein [Paludisphaera soli]